MENMQIDIIDIEELTNRIDEVRDVLNEICITIDENENKEDILKVSEYLDRLIVTYMKQIHNKS
jgi:two-component system cell cycle response regulator